MPSKGVVVLAISVDKDEKVYQNFLRKFNPSFSHGPRFADSRGLRHLHVPRNLHHRRQGQSVEEVPEPADWMNPQLTGWVDSVLAGSCRILECDPRPPGTTFAPRGGGGGGQPDLRSGGAEAADRRTAHAPGRSQFGAAPGGLVPYFASLERDPVHPSTYYLAVDGEAGQPLLLHTALANAPTSSLFRNRC